MMKSIRKIIKWFLTIVIIVSLVLVYFGYREYQAVITKTPILRVYDIVDASGTFTKIEDIAPLVLKGIVATEDSRYFTRKTVLDPRALARAMYVNVTTLSLQEGGSTIPQQVAKNLYFDHSASIVRKISEYFVTRDLLNNYNKNEILELYLNDIYFGDGFIGIDSASRGYFGVSPKNLNDGQATLLAGIPQAPSVYQLSSGYAYAKIRQKHVLNRLVIEKEIDAKTAEQIYKMKDYEGDKRYEGTYD